MANETPRAEAQAGAKPPAAAQPKKKSKLPLIIVAAVVVIGGVVGAWLALQPAADQAGAVAAAHVAPKAAPIYYKFDPAFVVNFGQEGSTHYLQLTVETMSRDAAVIEAIKNNEPAIRNDLVLLYSAQAYDTLVSAAGKEQLRADTLAAMRKVVAAEGARADMIEGVYFTSFVIQ